MEFPRLLYKVVDGVMAYCTVANDKELAEKVDQAWFLRRVDASGYGTNPPAVVPPPPPPVVAPVADRTEKLEPARKKPGPKPGSKRVALVTRHK
jgi:hypothetical protein